MNSAPKYSKVELLLKSKDMIHGPIDFNQTTRLEFNDAGLIITGDYIIVIEDETSPEHSLTSTGKIFHLSEIRAYRTYKS
jgi:hypothetical protein